MTEPLPTATPILANRCQRCGAELHAHRPTFAEIARNVACLCLLIAIAVSLLDFGNQWLERNLRIGFEHPVWSEPLEGWTR